MELEKNIIDNRYNSLPTVSVVIPVYNVEKYVGECLNSVIKQTYTKLDIIIINDGSTDSSGEICKSYKEKDSRIRLINDQNHGLGHARNVGIRRALGKYIIFLDSDDYWELNTIDKLVEEAERKSLQVVVFGAQPFYDGIEESQYKGLSYTHTIHNNLVMSGLKSLIKSKAKGEYYAQACLRLYRLDYIKSFNLRFDEGIIHEDESFSFLAYINASRVECLGDKFYHRRYRPGSIMMDVDPYSSAHGYRVAIDTLLKYMLKKRAKGLDKNKTSDLVENKKNRTFNNLLITLKFSQEKSRTGINKDKLIVEQLNKQIITYIFSIYSKYRLSLKDNWQNQEIDEFNNVEASNEQYKDKRIFKRLNNFIYSANNRSNTYSLLIKHDAEKTIKKVCRKSVGFPFYYRIIFYNFYIGFGFWMIRNSLSRIKRLFRRIYNKLISISKNIKCRADMILFPDKTVFSCPCCGMKFRGFTSGGFKDKPFRYDIARYEHTPQNVICPICNSLPRHRILALWCNKHKRLLRSSDILYFAQEPSIKKWMRRNKVTCTTADYYQAADLKLDIQSTELPDESYDIIICNHVLEHVKDFRKALKEVYRILRKGGYFICSFPIDPQIELLDEDSTIVTEEERKKRFGQVDHLRVFGRHSEQFLKEAGFEVMKIKGSQCPKEIMPVVGPGDYDWNELFWARKI